MAFFQETVAGFQENFETTVKIIEGVQTEILVFVIAIIAHTLVFGNHSVRKPPRALGSKHAKLLKLPQDSKDRPRADTDTLKAGMKASLVELKTAMGLSDLDGALSILKTIAMPWKASLGATPSGAPRHMLQQLLRLAVEQSKVHHLLDELAGCGLMITFTAEVLLDEASKLCSQEALDETRESVRASGVCLSSMAFSTLVRSARTGAEARRVLADAVEQRAASEDVITAATKAALAHSDSALAGDAFNRMPTHPSAELGSAVVHLVAHDLVKGQDVLQFFEKHLVGTEILLDSKATRCVAEAALHAKRQDILRELMSASSTGSRQAWLLRSFASDGRLKAAEDVFKACPEKTACLYNTLLDMYVDAREMAAAERLMLQASSAGVADVITYNTMIKAHLRAGDVRQARCRIESMRSVGLTPNCVTFNELIDAAFKSDPQAVWALVDEMEACGLKPNHVTCSILLKHVQRGSTATDVRRTLAILDSMHEDIDEILLSSICEACIRSGQQDLLRQQLKRQRGDNSVVVRGAHTFGSIIRAYGFVQDLAGVRATWAEMRKRQILPTSITLGCMVEALVSNDSPKAGYDMICEMLENPTTRPLVNAVIYCSVLKGFTHQKQYDRVWKIYAEMQANMKALHFSVATYNLLIDACARSCDMAQVPALLEEMSQQQIQPNVITFSTIVKGYCQENHLEKAFDLLEDMKKGKQFKPDEITYNTLLDGCARHGLYERGMDLLQDMQDSGVPPSNFTLSVLVKLTNRSHRIEKAFELCADISKKYRFKLNVHVYNNLINTCIQHREVDRALSVFQKALKYGCHPDARTYTLLLRALVAGGDARGAAGLLRAAYGLGGAHPALEGADKHQLQLRGGLPSDVMSEALEGIARAEAQRAPVAQLVGELRRAPGVRLDPRLALRLTSQGARRA